MAKETRIMGKRAAGILMPISSLPSDYGIGCFSKSAYEFVDWLKEPDRLTGRFCHWDRPAMEILHISLSLHLQVIHILLIWIHLWKKEFLIRKNARKLTGGKKPDEVDYEKSNKGRYPLLRKHTRTVISARILTIRNS